MRNQKITEMFPKKTSTPESESEDSSVYLNQRLNTPSKSSFTASDRQTSNSEISVSFHCNRRNDKSGQPGWPLVLITILVVIKLI